MTASFLVRIAGDMHEVGFGQNWADKVLGFMEGGEFNALVSMKVLNKEETTKIKAQ